MKKIVKNGYTSEHQKYNIIKNKVVFLYILFVVLMIFVIVNKENLHIDEVLTYGLANNVGGWMQPVNGEVYSPAVSAWMEYVSVTDKRFDYHMVWNNQAGDVHPPLYYALVHTISSIFLGEFSIWYAGVINIICAVLSFWTVRRLLNELTQDSGAVTLGSLTFVLSAGILSAVSFLRMYIMTMFEVTYVTWLFVRSIKREGGGKKFYVSVVGISIIGALTHYYFIVYLFFLCIVFILELLMHRKYKDIVLLIVSMFVAGGISIRIFPDMIKHMFLKDGYRGQESINNLKKTSLSEYYIRLKFFYSFINNQLFGGILTYIVIVSFILILYVVIVRKVKWKRQTWDLWILMSIPSVCFFLIVAKMAVMMESRYILPVYAVVLSGCFSFLYVGIRKIVDEKKCRIICCALVSIIIINGLKICTWEYLYSDSLAFAEKDGRFCNKNVLYVYDAGWKLAWSFFEASKYKNAVFFYIDEAEELKQMPFEDNKELLISIMDSCDSDRILNEILEMSTLLDAYEIMGSYGYTTTYYLYNCNTEMSKITTMNKL